MTKQYLDVRTLEEWQLENLSEALHIPLQYLPTKIESLDRETEYLVFCRSGQRAQLAVDFLISQNFKASNVGSLKDIQ